MVKQLIELVYYYRAGQAAGKPYWQDPTVIGLIVGILAAQFAKYMGVAVSADLQVAIVSVVTGIGALLSPQTGIKKLPAPASKADASRNLTSLSGN